MFGGQLTTGGWLSFTATANAQAAALPLASVAVHATIVGPRGKRLPDAGMQTRVAPGQLSSTLALKVTCASHLPGSAATVMSPGQITCGSSKSFTFTVNVQ